MLTKDGATLGVHPSCFSPTSVQFKGEFLNDSSLSGTATKEKIELLKKLRFNGKRPTSFYYYREL
jgi:hypothetical protein